MSAAKTNRAFFYVVARDYGFAPNPFHGVCTLATCKPRIRNRAQVGDWVIGIGGARLNATGKCVYAMKVTEKMTFDEYWQDHRFISKKPIRNGSKLAMAGDNIYHRTSTTGSWIQEDSHHSNADGSPNIGNRNRDTLSENVLISDHFYYFGKKAVLVPPEILTKCGYTKNQIGHRNFDLSQCLVFIAWLESTFPHDLNIVIADPFDFASAHVRYDQVTNKVS